MSKTAALVLTFDIGRQDDDGWPWVISLEKIEPRGTGIDVPCGCSGDNVRFTRKVCDACAVELSIDQLGPEEWLVNCCDLPIITDPMPDDNRFHLPACVGRTISCEGTLTVRGFMEWSGPSGAYEDDYEEWFIVDGSDFTAEETKK